MPDHFSATLPDGELLDRLMAVIERHWGYTSLRPLQAEAMRAALAGRDSLVVMPTGGGKSLCYQAPAVHRGGLTVVVSPLVSLMKDQVDGLRACKVAALALNSSISPAEQRESEEEIRAGWDGLLFASPERMATPGFRALLQSRDVRTFAIDEAHCISHWGHDFRPDYRQLGQLKRLFPNASIHAFTATATQQVRDDIVAQLGLDGPEVLVGNFDRPNLTYRVERRRNAANQVLEYVERRPREAGIVYCIRRADVDELTPMLAGKGIRAVAYHAGLSPDARKAAQNAFCEETCDVVVATVAFGMGIDRANVRYILHAGMPKSIEHYQQETGRAGRDGLPAECVLFYAPSDSITWERLLEKSVAESDAAVGPEYLAAARRQISEMDSYCRDYRCRHRMLVEHFDQPYPHRCNACDVCLAGAAPLADAQTIAKKILSCVARLREQYGAGYVIRVLRGAADDVIRERGHDRLSTFGLLAARSKAELRDWIEQLIGQNVLVRAFASGKYPVLQLNEASWDVMADRHSVQLYGEASTRKETSDAPRRERRAARSQPPPSSDAVDDELFEALCVLRRKAAQERGIASFMVFHNTALQAIAAIRPSTLEQMAKIRGVGPTKLRDYGEAMLEVIDRHASLRDLSRDQFDEPART